MPINAFNDIFYREKVEFIYKAERSELNFYSGEQDGREFDEMMSVKSQIEEIALLIEDLEQRKLLTFLAPNSTNTLDSIGGFIKDGLKSTSVQLDNHISGILFRCMNNVIKVTETLKAMGRSWMTLLNQQQQGYSSGLFFEVQTKKTERSDNRNSVSRPNKLPSFVLCHNDNWDDCGYHNWYCLHYFNAEGQWYSIGEFRLMHKEGESIQNLPPSFSSLNKDYCSLGNEAAFYENCYRILGEQLTERVLVSLQDCAVQLDVFNKYKDDSQFQSSLRRDQFISEKTLRLARFFIKGRNIEDAFKFKYKMHPPYNEKCETQLDVNFQPDDKYLLRCVGLIGENGVGKTRMLSSFISDLLEQKRDNFDGPLPIYSMIIGICSTPFDALAQISVENRTMP